MKTHLGEFFFPSVFITLSLIHPGLLISKETRSPSANLAIRVYNYAQIPTWTLARAENTAAEAFQHASLEVAWIDCPTTSEENSKFTSCPQDAAPTDMVLKIIAHFDSKREGFSDLLFGFAAGFQVSVICDRVEDLAANSECPPSKILGLMIAHEIGHALLGPHSHSPKGIMSPLWRPNDFRLATRRPCLFTDDQVEKIRLDLSKRAMAKK